MPVKFKVKELTEVAEAQRALYVPTARDGFYYLDVEGAADADQLTEFRNNNRKLMGIVGATTMDAAVAKLESLKDIDPTEYTRIKTELAEWNEGKGKNVTEMVQKKTEAMKADFDKKLTAADTRANTLSARLGKTLIDDALATAAASKGVLPSAIADVKLRGRTVFKLLDDKVSALDEAGQPIYGKNAEPMTIGEWMDKLATEAPHLFEANKGSGSGGGGAGGAGGHTGPNPWSKKTPNLTRQGIMQRDNPQLAEQLKNLAARE